MNVQFIKTSISELNKQLTLFQRLVRRKHPTLKKVEKYLSKFKNEHELTPEEELELGRILMTPIKADPKYAADSQFLNEFFRLLFNPLKFDVNPSMRAKRVFAELE